MSYTDNVIATLKKNIEQFEKTVQTEEVGTVIEVKDGITVSHSTWKKKLLVRLFWVTTDTSKKGMK